MPKVYNKYHNPPPGCISIMRDGPFGNPFSHMAGTLARFRCESREEAVARYGEWIETQPALLARARRELVGKNLLCCCKPKACHGDILIRLVNPPEAFLAEEV